MVCASNHQSKFGPRSSFPKQTGQETYPKKLPDYHDNLFFKIISLKYTCHQITIYKEPNNSNEAPLQIFSFAKIKCTI